MTNTEPDKHLAFQWIAAERLPEPMSPTTAQALTACGDGDPSFSGYGWPAALAK